MVSATTLFMLGLTLLSWSAGRLLLPLSLTFLRRRGFVSENYRTERVPTSYGIVLLAALLAIYLVLVPFVVGKIAFGGDARLFWVVTAASAWIALFGWLDDWRGNHEAKGFKGHWKKLWRERVVTTGLWKAIGGAIAAGSVAAVTSRSTLEWVVHSALIALATNWLNLLDLRPGRAAKFYLVAAAVLFAAASFQVVVALFLPLWLIVAATVKADLDGQLMLGDSGANLLGMQLGILAARVLPLPICVLLTALLAAVHVYAERHSLTALIDKVSWLRKIDEWGRTN